jgi:hypothetical protein
MGSRLIILVRGFFADSQGKLVVLPVVTVENKNSGLQFLNLVVARSQ